MSNMYNEDFDFEEHLNYLIDVNIKSNEVMASMINKFESNWGVIK